MLLDGIRFTFRALVYVSRSSHVLRRIPASAKRKRLCGRTTPSWTGTHLRDEFPVTRRWAFFDHAAVAPISAPASGPSTSGPTTWPTTATSTTRAGYTRVEEVRRLAGQLLNADPLDVAFVKNTSEGIGIVAEGFPWQPGDNVVTAARGIPGQPLPVDEPGVAAASRCAASPAADGRRRDRRPPRRDGRPHAGASASAPSSSPAASAMTSTPLGELCRERGVYFFVDAIQGLGVLPLDVRRTPIDFLAADGHKWLLGPEGAGLFYVRRELGRRSCTRSASAGTASSAACDFATIDFRLKPHAGRWEGGTLNVAGITALGASLELLLPIGIDGRRGPGHGTDRFCASGRERAGWRSSAAVGQRSDRASCRWLCRGDLRQLVRAAAGRREWSSTSRAGRVRVSPHATTPPAEIDRVIELCRSRPGRTS